MPAIQVLITYVSAVAAGLSLAAIAFALRGRRTDDHPLCRACGFDLFNLPPTSHNCPECGRDLRRPRATRIGHRIRRGRILWSGLAILVPATGWLVFFGIMTSRGVNWDQYKPVSWLIRETKSPATYNTAMNEVTRRLARGLLSDADLRTLAQFALAHQANRSEPWIAAWGEFLESARAQRRLMDAEWEKYIAQGCDHYQLDVRPRVRRGTSVPIRLRVLPVRLAAVNHYAFSPQATCEIDGQIVRADDWIGSLDEPFYLHPKGVAETVVPIPPAKALKLRDSEHQLGVTLAVAVLDDRSGRRSRSLDRKLFNAAPCFDIHLQRAFQLSDQATPEVKLRYDSQTAASVEKLVSVVAKMNGDWIDMNVSASSSPIDLAFDARLTWHKINVDLGTILIPSGATQSFTIPVDLGLKPVNARPTTVDVVFIPSPRAAEDSVDMTTIYGGQLEWRELPVTPAKPATAPTARPIDPRQ